MKRNFILILVIILVISPYTFADSANEQYIKIENPNSWLTRELLKIADRTYKEYLSLDMLRINRDCINDIDLEQILSHLNNLPLYILQNLHDKGLIIYALNEPVVNHPQLKQFKGTLSASNIFIENSVGLYVPEYKSIYYDTTTDGFGYVGSPLVLYHELGHAVDDLLFNKISRISEFALIVHDEAEEFSKLVSQCYPTFAVVDIESIQTYYTKHPFEYFADAFAWYLAGSPYANRLKYNCPSTFNFIKGILDNQKEQSNFCPLNYVLDTLI